MSIKEIIDLLKEQAVERSFENDLKGVLYDTAAYLEAEAEEVYPGCIDAGC